MRGRKRRRRLPSEPREAAVERLDRGGDGVVTDGERTVLVAGALSGETIRYEEIDRRRGVGIGRVLEVLRAASSRVTPPCPHFGLCGGCSLQHMAPDGQVERKQQQLLDDLVTIGGVTPQEVLAPVRGPTTGYRRRARLGIKHVPKKGKVLVGFRERDKRFVADLSQCSVLAGEDGELIASVSRLVDGLSIRDRIPQVEVTVADDCTALVFRVLDAPSADDIRRLTQFGRGRACLVYLQTGGPDTITPIEPTDDDAPLSYRLEHYDVELRFGPGDFIQVNLEINASMVALALELLDVGPADRVLDLFCGIGNFSLPLARRAGHVVGLEADRSLVARASSNAELNGLGNASFAVADLYGDLGSVAQLGQTYDRVLLDPPRSGADLLVQRMRQLGPRRIVYVACSPESLARDAGVLVRDQGYRLVSAGVLDMFPHTAHVESIALFESG